MKKMITIAFALCLFASFSLMAQDTMQQDATIRHFNQSYPCHRQNQ